MILVHKTWTITHPPPSALHFLTSKRRQGPPWAGLPSCRPWRPRPYGWPVSTFVILARMGWKGQWPLRLQCPIRLQRTSRTMLPDRLPPAPSDWPGRWHSSQHPPLARERATSTPEVWPAKKKTFRVDYNPTGALHTESMGKITPGQKHNNSE